jgi:myosin heavy subunit
MACNPYFVRCIKPNSQKKTKFAERKLLIAQLSYSGMLETVRVRRAGYSNRTNFTDFLQRYAIINANVQKIAAKQPGEACRKIFAECKGIAKEWWEIGQTKVFMKSGAESILDGLRAERIMIFVLKLQAYFKMIVARSRYIRIKKATDAIQRAYRAHHARLHFKHMREGIIKAQASKLILPSPSNQICNQLNSLSWPQNSQPI